MFGYLYFPMFVTGLANSNADNIHSQTRHRGRGLCNFHQIIQHDSGIQFTNAHFSEKLFSIFMFFSFYFIRLYICDTLFFHSYIIIKLPCSILHCICKRKRQLLKIYLFSGCSEDISKNTGVLIPHLIDPPSCPPHFPRSLAQD